MIDKENAKQKALEAIAKMVQKAINDWNQDPHPEIASKYYSPGVAERILNLPVYSDGRKELKVLKG